tara:strand:+ start:1595 stop:2299 length:705 start_codon:yes stop_codon:yes gene_type:complete
MKLKKNIVALIAARKNSKGIKNKNLLKINNQSIVKKAVQIGLKIRSIDHLILSSDSQDILDLVKNNKKILKIKRKSKLARDNTPMLPVIQDAIKIFEKVSKKKISYIILLDPTSPFRLKKDIDRAIKIIKKKKLDLIVSVNEPEHNPYFSIMEKKGYYYSLSKGTNLNVGSRQEAKKVFNINTVVWIYSRRAIMQIKKRIPYKTDIIIIDEERSIEINTKKDLLKIKNFLKGKV